MVGHPQLQLATVWVKDLSPLPHKAAALRTQLAASAWLPVSSHLFPWGRHQVPRPWGSLAGPPGSQVDRHGGDCWFPAPKGIVQSGFQGKWVCLPPTQERDPSLACNHQTPSPMGGGITPWAQRCSPSRPVSARGDIGTTCDPHVTGGLLFPAADRAGAWAFRAPQDHCGSAGPALRLLGLQGPLHARPSSPYPWPLS